MALDEQHARLWDRWKKTATEYISVVLSSIAVIGAMVACIGLAFCVGIIWSQENRIDELQSKVETYSNRTIRLETWLKSKGIPLEEIPDD